MTASAVRVAERVASVTNNQSWGLRPLADVADILDSRRIPVNSKVRDTRVGSVPYYGATGQVGWIDDHLFDEELVLLGEDGAPFLEPFKAKAYVIRGKSWVNNHAHVLRARGVPTGWLAHHLNTISYEGLVTGTTRLKLTQAAMRQIRVPVAPRSVMERIVSEIETQFSRLDEAVANLKRVKANLKRYRTAILKAAVEGRLVADEFGVTSGNNWPLKPIDVALASIDQGWSPRCDRESSDGPEAWGVIKTTAVQPLSYVQSENKRLPDELMPREHLELAVGDVLVTRAGPRSRVGVACLIRATRPRLILCDKVYRLRARADVAKSAFLELVLNAPHIVEALDDLKTGISDSGVNLTQKRFRELSIPIPPLEEQERIVAEVERRLSMADESEAQVEASLRRAERLRRAILKRAFEGRLG